MSLSYHWGTWSSWRIYKPGSTTETVLLRRKCSQAVHRTHTFSSRQPQSKSLPPQTTQAVPGTERNLSLMVHFVGKSLFPVLARSISLVGLGLSSCGYHRRKMTSEECLAENQLLLLLKCQSLMCLIRPLLTIQQVKRQFCFLPEVLVWQQRAEMSSFHIENRKDPSGFHPYPLSQRSLSHLGKMNSGVVSWEGLHWF